MEIILTHENADFDAIASMLGAYKLNMEAIPILPKKQEANVAEFLTLYQNGLPFVNWDEFDDGRHVRHVTITDTTRRLDIKDMPKDVPTLIIEHHSLKRELESYETWAGDEVGATTTLLVERIREQAIQLTSLEATLMALGIYADTGNFTYSSTTARDIQAAAWLMENGAALDTVRRFLTHPLNEEQHHLFKQLMANIDSRMVNGFEISLCTTEVDEIISHINSVVSAIRNIVDVDALVVLVGMPDHVQLIARSTHDAIDVGQLAQHFGGGGHARASASAINGGDLDTIRDETWQYLHSHVQPIKRIADLMSFGDVQTVQASEKISDVIARIRRIGHEGYPVLDDGLVVGLLTLRNADKALEHGLENVTVRDVMESGNITLTPYDSVALLEETMVKTNWGQIPIVNGGRRLIGIVTRTDLIKHWGQTHPTVSSEPQRIDFEVVRSVLGKDNARLIEQIAKVGHAQGTYLYMVGGVVRDLLLERPNFDIDFVVEHDAIAFAEALQTSFGGRIHPYPPFRTATWSFDEACAEKLGVALDAIPEHVDFATARSELYEHPTALPTVFNSGIKLDLRRRDFTINTLAVQLSPQRAMWQILDFYGGMADLDKGIIRVLHSLSFVDDPTRILRAVRFSERLHFTIEQRTTELIQTALPMLKRITGERLQNELTLILNEENAVNALLKLEALGVLTHVHEDFKVTAQIAEVFARLRDGYPDWTDRDSLLRWHLLMGQVNHKSVETITKQLLFGHNKARAMADTAKIVQDGDFLRDPNTKPSQIVKRLSQLSAESLTAIWLWLDDDIVRQNIEHYQGEWRKLKPTVDGNTLKEMGLQPGPNFREILERLRDAWLDGEVYNETQEQQLLTKLISEYYHDRAE